MTTRSTAARTGGFAAALAAFLWLAAPAGAESTGTFSGAKVNAGTVSHHAKGGTHYLTLSKDFKPPDTPDPHWQIVDSKGNTYLLKKLMIKGEGYNRKIAVPAYVRDVARVQMWCAFAETLLGEASFKKPVVTARGGQR